MVVTIVTTVICSADHVTSQSAKPCTYSDSAKITADKSARDPTTDRPNGGPPAGGGPVAARGK